MKISSKISDTIVKIVTLKDVGITEFFSQTNQSVKQYNAYKEVLANNPELAMKLVNKDLPLEEKQKYANEFKFALEKKLGYSLGKEVKVISTDEKGQEKKDIKGFISTENDNMYSNDKNQHSTKETIAALGQEFAGAMQIKKGIDITTNRVQHNNYQDSISNDTVGDISFIMNTYHNKSLSKTNTHNQTTSVNSVFNLADNNSEFKGLDKSKGDNFAPLVPLAVIALANYLNAPEDEKSEIKQGPTDASYLIPGALGIKLLSTFGIKTLAKGSLITGGISGSIDATVQGIEMAFDPTKDYNVRDTAVSVGMGMTGNTLINIVNSGKKISTAGKIVYGKGVDSVVSATSQHLKTGNVEVRNILIDVAVGQGGNKISQLTKTKIENSKNMKVVDMFLDRQQRKINKGSTQTRINILNEVKDAKNKKITTSVLRTTSTSTGIASAMVNKAVDYYDKIEESNEK
ncbi:MAG: hypothetical protein HRT42_09850 [Campylobacteraceae bacterium]|nr:hypothetical protein [Campylobacteraceae bacterium]